MAMYDALLVEKLVDKIKERGSKLLQRDRTISNCELELEECKRQSQINDELRSEADATLESYQETLDKLCDRLNLHTAKAYEQLVDEVDRHLVSNRVAEHSIRIARLEAQLDRARFEYLGQLTAIAQMLEPLATHEDKGSLYLSHFGKAAMVYMIQQVILKNIEKLNPSPCTYSDGF